MRTLGPGDSAASPPGGALSAAASGPTGATANAAGGDKPTRSGRTDDGEPTRPSRPARTRRTVRPRLRPAQTLLVRRRSGKAGPVPKQHQPLGCRRKLPCRVPSVPISEMGPRPAEVGKSISITVLTGAFPASLTALEPREHHCERGCAEGGDVEVPCDERERRAVGGAPLHQRTSVGGRDRPTRAPSRSVALTAGMLSPIRTAAPAVQKLPRRPPRASVRRAPAAPAGRCGGARTPRRRRAGAPPRRPRRPHAVDLRQTQPGHRAISGFHSGRRGV